MCMQYSAWLTEIVASIFIALRRGLTQDFESFFCVFPGQVQVVVSLLRVS